MHDESAARLDGVSAHAGLFSDAEDLLVFADWLLALTSGRPGGPAGLRLHAEIVGEFTRRQHLAPGSSRALGWDPVRALIADRVVAALDHGGPAGRDAKR